MRNKDTAIGSTNATTFVGCCSRERALSIIAGNEASEDCVLAATICAGRMAGANRRKQIDDADAGAQRLVDARPFHGRRRLAFRRNGA